MKNLYIRSYLIGAKIGLYTNNSAVNNKNYLTSKTLQL